jgi:hypothetical protein
MMKGIDIIQTLSLMADGPNVKGLLHCSMPYIVIVVEVAD